MEASAYPRATCTLPTKVSRSKKKRTPLGPDEGAELHPSAAAASPAARAAGGGRPCGAGPPPPPPPTPWTPPSRRRSWPTWPSARYGATNAVPVCVSRAPSAVARSCGDASVASRVGRVLAAMARRSLGGGQPPGPGVPGVRRSASRPALGHQAPRQLQRHGPCSAARSGRLATFAEVPRPCTSVLRQCTTVASRAGTLSSAAVAAGEVGNAACVLSTGWVLHAFMPVCNTAAPLGDGSWYAKRRKQEHLLYGVTLASAMMMGFWSLAGLHAWQVKIDSIVSFLMIPILDMYSCAHSSSRSNSMQAAC